jgi:hypothetical protein
MGLGCLYEYGYAVDMNGGCGGWVGEIPYTIDGWRSFTKSVWLVIGLFSDLFYGSLYSFWDLLCTYEF